MMEELETITLIDGVRMDAKDLRAWQSLLKTIADGMMQGYEQARTTQQGTIKR